jgi:uncharacterized HAD superfamily protein
VLESDSIKEVFVAKVGCDIDGVLYDWEGQLREQAPYLHLQGMPHELTDEQEDALWVPSSEWDYLPNVLGKENWNWVWANQAKIEAYLGPRDYGREQWEALCQLTLRHEVYLVTSRPRDCWYQTYIWVASLHPQPQLQGILHSSNKVKTAMGLDLDVLVDDRPSELEKYRDHALAEHHRGVLVYGVRRPWNAKLHQDPEIVWVDGVADLLKEPWA